ncbi:MAG: MJ1255/VC2487 family glycosyltransferase [Nanoarchaeota archaeon]
MAKILYGIAKEGMGHAVRSKVLIKGLSENHKFLILAGGKQYNFLKKSFNNIICIDDFDLTYINNSISYTLTFLKNLFKFPFIIYYIIKNYKLIKRFDPDLIISDFEPITNYLSYLLKKPLITVDNQHISTKCNIQFPKNYNKDFFISSVVIYSIITNAGYYLIPTFFYPQVKEKNVFLVPPVIRKEIQDAKILCKDHIIVYQTSGSNKRLMQLLKKTGNNYIFYGSRRKKDGNITFKQFSETEFIDDLASCKAVITNGGFGLISEAIYLKKPVLSIPIKKQFEQILNAVYLKKLGYGAYHLEITKKRLDHFINNIDIYKRRLQSIKKHDNSMILKKIEEILHS